MFSFRNGHLAVLLCAFTQSLVFASSKDDAKKTGSSSTNIDRYSPAGWKEVIESAVQSSKSTCVAEVLAVTEATESGQGWTTQIGCPLHCNETQAERIMNVSLRSRPIVSDLGSRATGAPCAQVEAEDFTVGEIVTIIVMLALVVFSIFCTVCDFVRRRRPAEASTAMEFFSKFSLYKHTLEMLETRGLPSIQGIKVLSMCWIIIGHQFCTLLAEPTFIRTNFENWYDTWTYIHAKTSVFAIDTFFVVSGFLLARSYCKAMKAGISINWRLLYLHRYLRTTPCLAVAILFFSFLGHRFMNSPVWGPYVTANAEQCRDNWWINLLYIQNHVKKEEMCLLHTWYLAAEMQLFWISSIILYSIHRWPKYAFRLFGCLMAISVVIPPLVVATEGYSTSFVNFRVEQGKIISRDGINFHMTTYNRGFPYFLGILLGYDVVNRKRHLTKVNAGISWAVACVLMLLCVGSTHYVHKIKYNLALETAFALASRPFWSIAVAWIIYASTEGYGGYVTSFLSSPFFQPLGRFSYQVFLVHLLVLIMRPMDEKTLAFVANSTIIRHYLTNLVLSIGLGFISFLFFETPFVVLENILSGRVSESNRASPTEGFDKKTRIRNKAAKDN